MIDEIRGNIVAVKKGTRFKYDLTHVNDLLLKHLKARKLKFASNDLDADMSYYVYPEDQKDHPLEYNVNGHPHEFEYWDKCLTRKGIPRWWGKGQCPTLVAQVKVSLPIVLSRTVHKNGTSWTEEGKLKTARRLYRHAKSLFTILKKDKEKIVPERGLALLLDNGQRHFTPKDFLIYLRKHNNDVGYAYDGSLIEN